MMEEVEYQVNFGGKSLKFTKTRKDEAIEFYNRLKEENKVSCSLFEITHREIDYHMVGVNK